MTEQQAALIALLELQAVDSELYAIMVKAKSLRESERVTSLLARRAQAIEAAKQLDARGKEAASAADIIVTTTPSTTPRGRRSTRSGGCSACPNRAARTSTGSHARATPGRSGSRAGSPPPLKVVLDNSTYQSKTSSQAKW